MSRHQESNEPPRARLLRAGAQSLSDAELLAVVIRNGCRDASALRLASELLAATGGLPGLAGACARRLRRPGIGRAKVAAVLAAVEVGRRMARARVPDRQPLSRPERVARYLDLRYGHLGQEIMGALYCDTRHRMLAECELFRGTLFRAAVEPREVLRAGLLCQAAGVIIFHTHPSGDPAPSREDLQFTRRLNKACEAVGVYLVDHLIVAAGGGFVSLRDRMGW